MMSFFSKMTIFSVIFSASLFLADAHKLQRDSGLPEDENVLKASGGFCREAGKVKKQAWINHANRFGIGSDLFWHADLNKVWWPSSATEHEGHQDTDECSQNYEELINENEGGGGLGCCSPCKKTGFRECKSGLTCQIANGGLFSNSGYCVAENVQGAMGRMAMHYEEDTLKAAGKIGSWFWHHL